MRASVGTALVALFSLLAFASAAPAAAQQGNCTQVPVTTFCAPTMGATAHIFAGTAAGNAYLTNEAIAAQAGPQFVDTTCDANAQAGNPCSASCRSWLAAFACTSSGAIAQPSSFCDAATGTRRNVCTSVCVNYYLACNVLGAGQSTAQIEQVCANFAIYGSEPNCRNVALDPAGATGGAVTGGNSTGNGAGQLAPTGLAGAAVAVAVGAAALF